MDMKIDIFDFDDCIGKQSLQTELVAHKKVGHAPVTGVDRLERKYPFSSTFCEPQQVAYKALHYYDTELLFLQTYTQSRSYSNTCFLKAAGTQYITFLYTFMRGKINPHCHLIFYFYRTFDHVFDHLFDHAFDHQRLANDSVVQGV